MIIETKEKAYVLGFLWADGHLNKKYTLSLKLNETDAIFLQNIILQFENFNIYKSNRKGHPTWQNSIMFYKGNKSKYKILEDAGFREKSYINHDKILKLIPENLHNYFWRGYFDGDGCVYLRQKEKLAQICLASTYEQDWSVLVLILKQNNINSTIQRIINHKGQKSSHLRITGLVDIINFIKFIYPNDYDEIGLYRKYEKFICVTNWYNKRMNEEDRCVKLIKENAFKLQKQDMCKMLNISVPKVVRIIKQYKIVMPPRNFWHKKENLYK